jgi:hypothetical protein
MVEGAGPKGAGGVFICRKCAELAVSMLREEGSATRPDSINRRKPFQFGLGNLFGLMATIAATLALTNLIPPDWAIAGFLIVLGLSGIVVLGLAAVQFVMGLFKKGLD